MTISPMNISEDKQRLRREAESVRYSLAHSTPGAAAAITQSFFNGISIASGVIVAGYVPTRSEADPLPLMEGLRTVGHPLALARVAEKDRSLHFHLWRDNEAPVKSAFSMMEAAPDWPSIIPDVLLIPLLGFDKNGYRLGYGGGFYDRSLHSLRMRASVLAVGIAFAGQEMVLPHDEHDERLNWIVTEKYSWQV